MKTTTTITNDFTGYRATIRTAGVPAIATLRRHIRASKASDCQSVTRILTNVDETGAGDEIEISKFGELLINGRPV